MDCRTLLIFNLDGTRFGLDAACVIESVWLPELTTIEEALPWIVGMFSLRGQIIPVANLHLRFGHPARPYNLSDQVVVLKTEHMPIGLIVSEVLEVVDLPADAIQPPPEIEAAGHGLIHFAAGVVGIGDDLVTLLDVSRLTKLPEISPLDNMLESTGTGGYFCAQATLETRTLFHGRAMALREVSAAEGQHSPLGLAVVELSGEYFGIELAAVQEFCNIAQLSPIPCCPPHILGAMNLRGSLLTLIDPRSALNLPPSPRGHKAVIARLGEQLMGIAVDEVCDAVYLGNEALQPPPSALRYQCGSEITGTAPYAGRTMTVLDLPALLAREDWIVDENV